MARESWLLVGALAPTVLVGTLTGRKLAGRISVRGFDMALIALLILAGVGAIASAW
jgi:uncharacterized membrane protein YfcA